MRNLILLMVLLANQTFAETEKSLNLNGKVEHVTVYTENALVTRSGSILTDVGRSVITVKGLSPYIDPKSIQVKVTGAVTVLSVNHNLNYLDDQKKSAIADSLNNILEELELSIDKNKNRLEVLVEKMSLLNENKKLGNDTSSPSISQLKMAVEFYDQELMSIKNESLTLQRQIKEYQEKSAQVKKQLEQLYSQNGKPTGEILIRTDAQKKGPLQLSISYLVSQAGWFPKYDIRVANIESPLQLTYKAEVHQNTGEDWENVRLRFSNGNPNQNSTAPELTTWFLDFQRFLAYDYNSYEKPFATNGTVSGRIVDENGDPVPGANVIFKGTSIGTVSDLNGYYSIAVPNGASSLSVSSIGYTSEEVPITSGNMLITMAPDVTQLSEIVVMGYGSRSKGLWKSKSEEKPQAAALPAVQIVENKTTVDFEVATPYTLRSNGELLLIDLKKIELYAIYQYYAVPKIEKEAFLIARVPDWDKYNLLEGEANLYFEDTYVGRSVLNARNLSDTLDVSLGRDKSILIGREKTESFSKQVSLGNNKTESRGFNLMARNKKAQLIHITVFDQIPVTSNNDINVTPTELSDGLLDPSTGKVRWEFTLEPQKQKDIKLAYDVRYPKRENLVLE